MVASWAQRLLIRDARQTSDRCTTCLPLDLPAFSHPILSKDVAFRISVQILIFHLPFTLSPLQVISLLIRVNTYCRSGVRFFSDNGQCFLYIDSFSCWADLPYLWSWVKFTAHHLLLFKFTIFIFAICATIRHNFACTVWIWWTILLVFLFYLLQWSREFNLLLIIINYRIFLHIIYHPTIYGPGSLLACSFNNYFLLLWISIPGKWI